MELSSSSDLRRFSGENGVLPQISSVFPASMEPDLVRFSGSQISALMELSSSLSRRRWLKCGGFRQKNAMWRNECECDMWQKRNKCCPPQLVHVNNSSTMIDNIIDIELAEKRTKPGTAKAKAKLGVWFGEDLARNGERDGEATPSCLIYFEYSAESRSFENSYIPENPRTPKPSLYNTYLKRFVKKNLKKNAKKKLHICTKNKKKLHICKRFRSRFFERNNGLGDIGNWGSSRCWDLLRTHIFPRTRELPQFPISPKPLFLSKNRLRDSPKRSYKKIQKNFVFLSLFFRKFFFATGLKFERFLAPQSRFFEKVNGLGVLGSFENSYISENPRTHKPLTFSKNRLRGAKNRSNISPVAKKFFRKNDFFFPKTLHMCKLFFCAYVHRFRSRFFERNNGLGDIGNWGSSRKESVNCKSESPNCSIFPLRKIKFLAIDFTNPCCYRATSPASPRLPPHLRRLLQRRSTIQVTSSIENIYLTSWCAMLVDLGIGRRGDRLDQTIPPTPYLNRNLSVSKILICEEIGVKDL
ncbi:hypothetical protein LXL04_011990 [Taraxacum kok-saghyz]